MKLIALKKIIIIKIKKTSNYKNGLVVRNVILPLKFTLIISTFINYVVMGHLALRKHVSTTNHKV